MGSGHDPAGRRRGGGLRHDGVELPDRAVGADAARRPASASNAAIDRLGYRPNRAAQGAAHRSHPLHRTRRALGREPVLGRLRQRARARGRWPRATACCSATPSATRRGSCATSRICGTPASGPSSSARRCPAWPTSSRFIDRGLRLVTFDRPIQPDDPPSVVSVSVDNHVGGFLAAAHLIGLGHRKLTFVAGSLHSLNRAARYRGFCAALEEAGLDPDGDADVARPGDVTLTDLAEAAEVGRAAVRDLLSQRRPADGRRRDQRHDGTRRVQRHPRAGTARRRGRLRRRLRRHRAGERLSDPPLTTVRQPLAELAQLAIREALAERSDEASPGRSILLRPELVIRCSTRQRP